ncbi:hypothetical protein [Agrobacterium pusense]|uniref:hypothetical protein n=1 Tax=Agrobacterium pusense TaxID=648995 RepID=UPI0022B89E53|nr:hypothetical protein [Agrobacterium pusense]MCZ7926183.1 hypothetical protein [Agrobacterium pusense]
MSSKKTTTQESKVEPWGPFQPLVQSVGQQYYDKVQAGQPAYYPGSTIAGQSNATLASQNMLANYANNGNANSLLNNSQNVTNNLMATGGANQQANNVLSQLMSGVALGNNPALAGINQQAANFAAQGSAPGTSTYNSVMNGGQNAAIDNLKGTASGANVGNNPYLNQMISNQQDQIANKLQNVTLPGMTSQATALGRKGSGAFANQINNATQTAANEMAKVGTELSANQYNQDMQNMLTANNQMGNLINSDTNNKLNAANSADNSLNNFNNMLSQLLGQQSNAYQQGVNNQFTNAGLQQSSAQAANNASQQQAATQANAANNAANIWSNGTLPGQLLGQVGAAQDERAQDELNARIQEWDFNQQMPLQQLANAMSVLTGGGFNNTTSVTTQKGSALGGILGGLSSGLGLLSKLPCDMGLKENIKYVGEMPNGIKLYEFNYRNDNKKYIGPMAQEVLETHPLYVGENDDGTLFVHGDIVEAA